MILLRVYKDLAEFTNEADIERDPQYWLDVRSVYEKLLIDQSRLRTHHTHYLTDPAAISKLTAIRSTGKTRRIS